MDYITRLRFLGDGDRSSEIRALTAKLIGNSVFGSCIANKDKHRHVLLSTMHRSPMPQGYWSTEDCYHPALRYGGDDAAAPADQAVYRVSQHFYTVRADLPLSPRGRAPAHARGLRPDTAHSYDDL